MTSPKAKCTSVTAKGHPRCAPRSDLVGAPKWYSGVTVDDLAEELDHDI